MMTLPVNDLARSEALDRRAMTQLKGGERRLRYAVIVNGPWHVEVSSQYLGLAFHDGYLSRHMLDTYKRTRTQTEYSYYDVFTRV